MSFLMLVSRPVQPVPILVTVAVLFHPLQDHIGALSLLQPATPFLVPLQPAGVALAYPEPF